MTFDCQTWLGDLTKGNLPANATLLDPRRISTDSRTVSQNDWFIPLVGTQYDGHQHIEEALNKGAIGFFYEARRVSHVSPAILKRGWAVTSTLKALQAVASRYRQTNNQTTVVGLTGSSGKTTVKELLNLILSKAGPTLAAHGSFNNEIGVPKTLLKLGPQHRYAVLEFGARHAQDIKLLSDIGRPDIAGCLNVGRAHLGEFGSEEALFNTKMEIYRYSSRHCKLVAPTAQPNVLAAAKDTGKEVFSFGKEAEATVRISGEQWLEGGRFKVDLIIDDQAFAVTTELAHEKLSLNIAAACAFALAAGVTYERMITGLAEFSGVDGRYKVHRCGNSLLVDDSYNANPESMLAGLATFARAYNGVTYGLVLGDMLELGAGSAQDHFGVGEYVGRSTQPSGLYLVGPQARHIGKGAISAGFSSSKICYFDEVENFKPIFTETSQRYNVLYLKASNGIGLHSLVSQFKQDLP